ncbi:MAG: amidohydrolase [Rhizobiales bacterium]|nr:amidohydrolase [Hyphomicrobiales bacterium]
MIVDCHVNIWEDRHLPPLFAEQMARIRPGGMGLKADADTLYLAMAKVDKAILFTLRYGDSAGIEGDDETTADAVARYPEKFVGFAYADPRRPDCIELLRHAVEDLGMKGVKYGPIYNGVPLDDPRMTPIYEYCVANDLPLTMHMGTTFAKNAPVDLGRAIHAEPVALRYPDLKMILAHMGHPWFEDCIAVIRKQPNVYAEVSAIFYRPWQFYNIMMSAQEYLVTDKIFFGTDFPFSSVEESLEGMRAVNEVVAGTRMPRISDEVIEGIIHANPFEHWWHDNTSWRPMG